MTGANEWYDGADDWYEHEAWGSYDPESQLSEYYSTEGDYYGWYDQSTEEWGWTEGETGDSDNSSNYDW